MIDAPRTDWYWYEINKDNVNGFTLALKMRDHARKVESSLIFARGELHTAQEERDILKSKYLDHHAEAERITSEIRRVTEQRDRLAEALNRIIEEDGRPMSMKVCSTKSLAQQALQCLNQPTEP